MPLAELQARFATAVSADEGAADPLLLARIRGDGIDATTRLDVYRRNVRGNFVAVMEAEFPAIRALGGDDWFAAQARAFMREHPSRGGDLHDIGAPFAAFLAHRLAATPYGWFADVAALEWAWQESLVAADADTRLDVGALAAFDPRQAAAIRLRPHPALRVIASRWPVFRIWNAHRAPADVAAAPIDLHAGGEAVILRRSGQGCEARLVDAATCVWLRALVDGATLGSAWDRAIAVDAQFDLSHALADAVALGLFVGFDACAQ